MYSIWSKTAQRPHFKALDRDVATDVLIVGGGLAGILCAFRLEQAGVDYVLVEADKIGNGITGNTTAKITLQHGRIYDDLIRTFGVETARLYLEANRRALEQYRQLCRTIDCDFQECDSFVYSLDNREKIKREVAALHKLGFPARLVTELPLPFSVAGAVQVGRQAQFHPLKFLFSVAKPLRIFENTNVLELRPGGAITNNGKIAAKKILITTHFPFLNKHGAYFLKLYQHRSYVLALENAPELKGIYVDEAEMGLSFRRCGEWLLLGGGSHRTGKKGGGWRELEAFARRYYPDAREVCRWATQDCMTLDGIPYIGSYAKHTPHLYVATGFNKWGMTSAMVAADLLADRVLGKANPFEKVFSPNRTILRPQLAVNAAESIVGLLTPTVPRCPHLGCALKYNPQEHSWDCPCHGSRFAEDGKLLNNPATDDKRK